MHHPVQYQVTAKNIQKDRLRAAQASRLASQSGPSPSGFLGLPIKLLGAVRGLLILPFKVFRNEVQEPRDAKQYSQKMAGRYS